MVPSMRLGFRKINYRPSCGPRPAMTSPYTPLFASRAAMPSPYTPLFAPRPALFAVGNSSKGLLPSTSTRIFHSESSKKSPQLNEFRRSYYPFGSYTLQEFKKEEGDQWLNAIFDQTMNGKLMLKIMRPLMEYCEVVEESSNHHRFEYFVKAVNISISWMKYLLLIALGPWLKKMLDEFRGKTKQADERLQEMKRQLKEREIWRTASHPCPWLPPSA